MNIFYYSCGVKVEIPSNDEYIFDLSLRQSERKITIHHDSNLPFIYVCGPPDCIINQMLESASNQIIDLINFFGGAIRIKVRMNDHTHEQYINQKIQTI